MKSGSMPLKWRFLKKLDIPTTKFAGQKKFAYVCTNVGKLIIFNHFGSVFNVWKYDNFLSFTPLKKSHTCKWGNTNYWDKIRVWFINN